MQRNGRRARVAARVHFLKGDVGAHADSMVAGARNSILGQSQRICCRAPPRRAPLHARFSSVRLTCAFCWLGGSDGRSLELAESAERSVESRAEARPRYIRRVTTREAARFHLAHAIALRFAAGAERDAWLMWLQLDDVARRAAALPCVRRARASANSPNPSNAIVPGSGTAWTE
jgi:hypothetical protein